MSFVFAKMLLGRSERIPLKGYILYFMISRQWSSWCCTNETVIRGQNLDIDLSDKPNAGRLAYSGESWTRKCRILSKNDVTFTVIYLRVECLVII